MVEARGPVRSAICFRSILSRQNGLNRHIEQNIYLFGRKSSFSVFRLIDPLLIQLLTPPPAGAVKDLFYPRERRRVIVNVKM